MPPICREHPHSSEKTAIRCALKNYERKHRRRMRYVNSRMEPLAVNPAEHVVVNHRPPRKANRGGIELLVWSEATCLLY